MPVISPAAPADLGAVARIYAHYVTDTVVTFEETPPTVADWRARHDDLAAPGLPILVATVDGVVADPSIGFVYAEKPAGTPFARCLEVVDELPVAVKKMRAALRSYDIGRLEIRKRGSALDVEKLRHDLRLSGTGDGVLLLTRIADRPAALLCRRGE
ncbi:hypothetical protein GCM10009557_75360 [Virgisporangium ochraceum]